MNWAEAVVVIVIVSTLAKVVAGALHHRRDNPVAPAPDQSLRREVEDLRERVRVLERIAIDERKTRELSDEIERLR